MPTSPALSAASSTALIAFGLDSVVEALSAAAVSLAVVPALSWIERRTGIERGSASAVADSNQTLICSYLCGAVLLGLLLKSTLGRSRDVAVAGLVIAGFAVREGLEAWNGDTCATPVGMLLDTDADAARLTPHQEPVTPGSADTPSAALCPRVTRPTAPRIRSPHGAATAAPSASCAPHATRPPSQTRALW